MGAHRNLWPVALMALGACQWGVHALDLRDNTTLYRSPGYAVRSTVDRTAFLTPLVDEREGVPLTEDSPYPVDYVPENVWPRSLPQIVEEILVDELQASGVFAEISQEAPVPPDMLIVKTVLLTARCGQEERPFGRRSFGEVGLRVTVLGPESASGVRPVLVEKEFGEVASSDVSLQPPTAPKLLGNALRGAVQKTLGFLDQSNVARTGVPIDTGVSEAAGEATSEASGERSQGS